MNELKDIVAEPARRNRVVSDCVDLVESEVKSKGGLSGAVVKTTYAVVKALKPRIVGEVVDGLLDEFIAQLQPFYAAWCEQGRQANLESYLRARASDVAENLLVVTDRRAERSPNKTLVSAYGKLRPKGKEHVVAAVPGIGRVLDRHVSAA